MAMKISRVVIENFRCFTKTEIEFQKCHALVGENGSGKTSILEAINFATSAGMSYLTEQDFNNNDAGDLKIEVFFDEPFLIKIPDGYTSQDIPCQSVILEAHRREKASPSRVLSEPFVVEKYVVPLIYSGGFSSTNEILVGNIPQAVTKTANGYEAPRQTGSKFKFTKQRLSLQNDLINYPEVFYFDRKREDESKIGFNSLISKIAKDLNWQYRKKWNQPEVIAKWEDFYRLIISTVIDPKNDRIMKPLHAKLKKIAGYDFDDLEISLLDIEQPFSKAFLARRLGTNQIDQRNLGSGISILLAYFLIETICALSKSTMVFLVDEPELHLHPQLQQRIFEEFKSANFQTVYTTQSDCFIDISEWRSVSRFNVDSTIVPQKQTLEAIVDGKQIKDHLDELKKWHKHKTIFFREDNQTFFARKALLVEGPTEKYGLPVLATKLNMIFDGFTIISCNGKGKMQYYQLLCKAFEIPFFTLFDLDGTDKSSGENKVVCERSDQESMEMFKQSFESLLGIASKIDHKSSRVLSAIDEISVDKIPQEIKDAIKKISDWGKK